MSFWARFFPSERAESAYSIDYKGLYEKGYRSIIFDIDNTLVMHNAEADEKSAELIKYLGELGFKTLVLSNNRKSRVQSFAEANDKNLMYIHSALKPLKKGYIKALDMLGTTIENTIFVGDQILTDIWGAKRLGMYCILTEPIAEKEEIQIVFKRKLEKKVLEAYERSRKIN